MPSPTGSKILTNNFTHIPERIESIHTQTNKSIFIRNKFAAMIDSYIYI